MEQLFVRLERQVGTYKAQLIASKNRIPPIKSIYIVCLQLSGAVIGKQLRVFIQAGAELHCCLPHCKSN